MSDVVTTTSDIQVVDEAGKDIATAKDDGPPSTYKDIWHFADKTSWYLTWTSVFLYTAAGALQPLANIFFGDSFTEAPTMQTYWDQFAALGYMGIGILFAQGGAQIACVVAKERQIAEWKKEYLKAILRQDVGWYDCNNPQELSTRMGESIVLIEKALAPGTFFACNALGMGIAGTIIAFVYLWDLTLVVMALSPILLGAVYLMTTVQQKTTKAVQDAYAAAGGVSSETLSGLRTVASFSMEETAAEKYELNLTAAEKAGLRRATRVGLATSTFNAAVFYVLSVGLLYGCFMAANERRHTAWDYTRPANSSLPFAGDPLCALSCNPYDIANLRPAEPNCTGADLAQFQMTCYTAAFITTSESMMAVFGLSSKSELDAIAASQGSYVGCDYSSSNLLIALFSILIGMMGLGLVSQPLSDLTKAREACANVLRVVRRVPTIDSFGESGQALEVLHGAIEVADVVFAYPSAPHQNICNGYSLSIKAGMQVALCGPSGSGKSTIIGLLERFYDPQSGTITLDGTDLRKLNLRWLRSKIGLVGQEPVLFIGNVEQNIKYGLSEATHEVVVDAAKAANAHDFITTSLSDGYATQVGQGGGKLSGGQKQRVAIARAIIKKPAVLLLDEATSALDNASEKVVQAALEEIMTKQKRTTITIAHRLSTIRGADKIAVVQKGVIIEEGTYDELFQLRGVFHTLAARQEQAGEEDAALMVEMNERKLKDAEAAQLKAMGGSSRQLLAAKSSSSMLRKKLSRSGSKTGSRSGGTSGGSSGSLGSASQGRGAPADFMPAAAADEAATEAPAKPKTSLARLFTFRKPNDISLLVIGTCAAAITGGALAIQGYLMTMVLTIPGLYSPSDMDSETILWSMIYLGIGVAVNVFGTLEISCFGVAGEHLTTNLRSATMRALLRQEIGYFDEESHTVGALTEFLSEKVTYVQSLLGEKLQVIVKLVCMFVLAFVFMFVFGDWRVCLAMLGLLPILTAIEMVQQQAMGIGGGNAGKAEEGAEEKKSAGSLVGEAVAGIRTVASFNAEQRFFATYCQMVDELRDESVTKGARAGAMGGAGMGVTYVCFGAVLLYAGWLVVSGVVPEVDVGYDSDGCAVVDAQGQTKVMLPVFILMFLASYIGQVGAAVTDAGAANSAAEQLFELIDRESLCDPFSSSGKQPGGATAGAIEVADVVFAYPTRADFNICRGYSLSIKAGQKVALCGPSGSGKSTIIGLLERFYDPQSGTITLDGTDLRELNLRWLRSKIGLVGQEPVLFEGSVEQNIMYSVEGATHDDVVAAATAANAHDFITTDLGDGYQTNVGIKGGKLSGGQKQRVAIARSLARNPAIMLFDEATSALDNESEKVVQAALDKMMATSPRTTITIAHRLSTIRDSDVIAVVNRGKVAERGTHDELMHLGGVYQGLVMAQNASS